MAIEEGYTLQLICDHPGCARNRMWGGQLYRNCGGLKRVRDQARNEGWLLIFKPEEKAYCPKHAECA